MQKRYRKFFLAFFLVCCGACSSERSGLAELRHLCERDAGLTISKTVEADGYYDGEKGEGSLRVLLGSDFKFIEFCNENPGFRSLLENPGCGRYTRRAKGSALCDLRINGILEESVAEPFATFKQNYCVQLQRFEKPMARYRLHSNFKKWKHTNQASEFTRSEVSVIDAESDETIATYVGYSFNVRPGLSIAKSCEVFPGEYPSYREASLVGSVIKAY